MVKTSQPTIYKSHNQPTRPPFKLLCVFYLLFVIFHIQLYSLKAQDLIQRKVLSIVDTTDHCIDQSKAIYNWITHNIHYDVKAFLSGTVNDHTPVQTLKTKKGICYDYALLFQAMCQTLGIESYLVYGYTKDKLIYQRRDLYRSDHCWIAIHCDLSWVLCDPTWGSGFLQEKTSLKQKFISKITGVPAVKRRWHFIKSPDTSYFQPTPEQFVKTHLPLNPNWQLSEKVMNMQGFVLDTFENRMNHPLWKTELNNLRYLSDGEIWLQEGIHGKAFNQVNNYDLACGLLKKAEMIHYDSAKDSLSMMHRQINLELCRKAQESVNSYLQTTDSAYKIRLSNLKREISEEVKTYKWIRNEHLHYKKHFNQKRVSLSKKESIGHKRIQKYQQKVLFYKSINTRSFETLVPIKSDSSLTRNNELLFTKSLNHCREIILHLDSTFLLSYNLIMEDSLLTISLIQAKSRLSDHFSELTESLQKQNNIITSSSWLKLYTCFDTVRNLSRSSRKVQSHLASILTQVLNLTSTLEYEYINQFNLINRAYQLNPDPNKALSRQEYIRKLNIEYFLKSQSLFTKYQERVSAMLSLYNSGYYSDSQHYKRNKTILLWYNHFENELLRNQQQEFTKEKEYINTLNIKINKRISMMQKGLNSDQHL